MEVSFGSGGAPFLTLVFEDRTVTLSAEEWYEVRDFALASELDAEAALDDIALCPSGRGQLACMYEVGHLGLHASGAYTWSDETTED